MDAHANFAYSTVATAPSPATSGTSLVVAAGTGALFPATPFNATIWPVSSQPTTANAEIVRVTAVSTDTLTIVRAQEASSARTVVVGDQIAATITAKTLTDIETVASAAYTPGGTDVAVVDGGTGSSTASGARTNLGLGTLATQSGTFSGTSSGTNTGDQTTVAGNAGTATALATGRTIDGQTFDGTANITVIAPGSHAATSKTTPVDADELPLVDSAASNVLKKLTWANLKATVKAYTDTLYPAGSGTSTGTNTGDQTLPTDATITTTDVTTSNVSSSKHGWAPKAPADATKFLNGAATPAYASPKDSDLAFTDVTTNNVSSSAHGFAPKNPNDATKFLDGTGAYTVPTGAITRSARSSNTVLAAADRGKIIAATAAYTQTLTAAATLGSGWWCYIKNDTSDGTTVLVVDPNASETIDTLTTITMYSGETRLLVCDGANFQSVLVDGGFAKFTPTGGTFVVPAGIETCKVVCIGSGGQGGGGASSVSTAKSGGGGGGGAAVTVALLRAADLGSAGASVTVTVAAGGTGSGGGGASGAGGAASNGANGGTTSFGTFLKAGGGGGGGGGTNATSAAGGGGSAVNNAATSTGGAPSAASNATGIGSQGTTSAAGSTNGSEWGGATGGADAVGAVGAGGGSSIYGGPGGGAGGGVAAGNTGSNGGAGGANQTIAQSGGGTAGTGGASPTGASSANGTSFAGPYCGNGAGGGGGGTATGGAAGGIGGIGAGGGGGGASSSATSSAVGGAGGVGGPGECRVWYS